MSFGPTELLIVLGIVMLLFGSTHLPKLARSIGQAKHEFEHGERTVVIPPVPVSSVEAAERIRG
jgi:sec-independent protein translocase protein TatA